MDVNEILQLFKDRTPKVLGSETFSEYAILLPLIEVNGQTHVLFEVRSLNMRRQPGEICFPGGRIDRSDSDEKAAAIRETSEELGIHTDTISDVYPLDYIVSPFGTIIYPYVGKINVSIKQLKPNQAEVDEIFTTPLTYLQEREPDLYNIKFKMEPEESFPFKQIPGGENYNWQARNMKEHFYYYEDKVIWGLTARVLHHFVKLLS
ncbi:CoA pyrophosphatase [Rossellomorea aquimaris]|uniref:CoA pyrophosphatase n=1 Tax=Rossellomorea aquimaris TaxID=189382 RepID=A0A5D4THS0_9BACI|nr:CoA pyrophosphatase [Rossellomorea aquimaris]TYS75187.1 CoA pyrophosphatase [Rossellomorea aquimaris]TYS79564.1 CoA pyrophosphatase [Rossellomorea aquimaris]